MEKKRNVKKSTSKITKNDVNKKNIKNTSKIKSKKKKGFTLIELLAVIIILGILMIIAIPSVTKYINDSRKSAYVNTAKEIVAGARNIVNSGELEMYDTNVTYYIKTDCVKTENSLKSPYGDFLQAYVAVVYDGNGYTYYWTSVDDAGQGVKELIKIDKLNEDNIKSDLKEDDISTTRGIDGRGLTIVIDKANNCKKRDSNLVTSLINGETGTEEKRASQLIKMVANKAGQLNLVSDNDYIFKGENPNNYVTFNGETWRVLGIYGDQLKIIRKSTINPRSFKETSSDTTHWNESYVKSNLNNSFYNSLSSDSKEIIEEGIWYYGQAYPIDTALEAYNHAITSSDRANVGLIASYEFLYASDGEGCLNVQGKTNSFNLMCGKKAHNWLTGSDMWTLNYTIGDGVLYIHSSGFVHSNSMATFNSYPVVYLKSSTITTGGTGTVTSPYVLAASTE